MIFDIVEYIIMEWTTLNESRITIQDIQDTQEGAYPKKKKKSVTGQFVVVKYRSVTYSWTQKLNKEDYGVDTQSQMSVVPMGT